MKDFTKRIISVICSCIEVVINFCLFPLFYLKFFHEVSVREGFNEAGEIVIKRTDHYYSIIDNLKYDKMNLVYFSWALIAASIVASLAAIVFKGKRAATVGHVTFGISLALFLFVFFLASTVHRDY